MIGDSGRGATVSKIKYINFQGIIAMDFRPFRPLSPEPSLASRLISPPYDVMSTAEARVMGSDELSFLRVTRSELELEDGADPYAATVYTRAHENLDRLVAGGALRRIGADSYAIYRQTRGARTQIGIVGLASVAEYERSLVKRHELTRAEKEDDRTRHIDTTSAQTGPVFLAMKSELLLRELCVAITLKKPDVSAWLEHGGVAHEAWFVAADSEQGQALASFMAKSPAFYIADGHHRAASAMRVAKLKRAAGHTEGPWEHFLAVVFPAEWLEILPYNRVVSDLNGLTADGLLAAVSERFDIAPGSPVPSGRHKVSMLLSGHWYELAMKAVDENDPIASLDVAYLQDHLLAPILGITDPRRDKRIDFVGGVRGTAELEARVGHGVAFSMHPTSLSELFRVADNDQIMPPKSTWFEPKLADGMFVHSF